MLFIAEIGLNYNGNFDLACEMIRQAHLSGADIVKMQLGWKGNPGQINYINGEILNDIWSYANFIGIEIMFSIFTRKAFDMVKEEPFRRFKIASRTLKDDPALVHDIINLNKEVIISLGGTHNTCPLIKKPKNVRYLWCCSEYPAWPWNINNFPKDFSNSIFDGFSDHTLGIECALIAMSRGAQIIEKHFTLNKSDSTTRDHVLSATPSEFRVMVDLGKSIERYTDSGV